MSSVPDLAAPSDPTVAASAALRFLVALTILLGAFLLFAIEPMIAKMILPWFGGSAGVWMACLLFFQAALLAGYAYAHLLARAVPARSQWLVHVALLALSLAVLPVVPSPAWKPTDVDAPLLRIVALLSVTIGLPFVLLAATGPLLQSWLARDEDPVRAASVYRLYALSNFGSLAALLCYPILVEPLLPTHTQAVTWSAGYAVFAVGSAVVGWAYRSVRQGPVAAEDTAAVPRADRILWFLLAAVPSMLLLAVTNHMLRNVAAIPLLWVVPLALYLLTLIIAFDHPRWYSRRIWYALLPLGIGVLVVSVIAPAKFAGYLPQLALASGGFLLCCMIFHGELASLKPHARKLTSFYLTVAAGGAVGGLLVAAIAPSVFDQDYDLTITMLFFIYLLAFVVWRRAPGLPLVLRLVTVAAVVVASASLIGPVVPAIRGYGGILMSARNFYGPLQVVLRGVDREEVIDLQNGNILHGREYANPAKYCEPLTYFLPNSGIGIAITELGKRGPIRVGVIGLGAGTIAGYARPGDVYRFYEINPLVREAATRVFHYLSCAQEPTVAMGDARLTLEAEQPNGFDVLAVDAFTSDAIPVHLLTREAFALYWKHLKPGGILAVHVSNSFVDLAPVVVAAARTMGKNAQMVSAFMDVDHEYSGSDWVLVTDDPSLFTQPGFDAALPVPNADTARPWTDDYSNLWHALRRF
jgi:hypothetical protein